MFSNKWTLKTHQINAKYCLIIQKKNRSTFICAYCDVSVSTNQRLKTHIKNCAANSNKIQAMLASKDKMIEKLQTELAIYKQMSKSATECVEEIAKQPKIVQNTQNIQNNKLMMMTPFDMDEKTQEKISNLLEQHFGEDHFYDGQKGVARWAHQHLLKDDEGSLKYISTDPSRSVFKYKTSDGDIRKDLKAKKLSKMIGNSVKPITRCMYNDMKDQLSPDQFILFSGCFQCINEIDVDNGEFRSELSTLTNK